MESADLAELLATEMERDMEQEVEREAPSWDPDMVVILSGNGGDRLAEEIAGLIGLPATSCARVQQPGGEARVQLGTNVRGRDVFVVQSTCDPVNASLIELVLILSACRRASARRVTAITPYLGYSRQTRKPTSRVPISAADVATMLEEVQLDALVTIDVHTAQVAGFYSPNCCFDNLSYIPVAGRYLASLSDRGYASLSSPVVISPSATGVPRAMALVNALREIGTSHHSGCCYVAPASTPAGAMMADLSLSAAAAPAGAARGGGGAAALATATLAMLLSNNSPRGIKELELTGDVAGKDAILVDDIVDTAYTVVRSARELIARGAARVIAYATHGLLSAEAADRLARCEELSLVVLTNTVPTVISSLPADHNLRRKLVVLSVAPMIAHHICTLSGLPPPEIDALVPTYPLHGGSTAHAAPTMARMPWQTMRLAPGVSASESLMDPSLDDDKDGRSSVAESESMSCTTASEYSAAH